jgi:hypothetical protein
MLDELPRGKNGLEVELTVRSVFKELVDVLRVDDREEGAMTTK